ncbi:MAG TPA: hypothetical protein VGG39_36805 [Polyangiaceae bacterium]|jgi:hypothetical protein
MTATRMLCVLGWALLPVGACAVGCSSGASEASDAGQGADGTEPGGDASGGSLDGGKDASHADGALADGASSDGSAHDGDTGTGTGTEAGTGTIPWNGSNYYLYGVNYPWLSYGTDFGDGGFGHLANPDEVKTDMATFAGVGGHVLRWWVWVDGRYDPLFDASGKVTGFDSLFFSDLDTQLEYAADNHIYLDLTLFDTSLLDPAQTVNGVAEGGHAALVTDPTVQQSFLDNALKPFLQHVAASPYKDYVLAYDIMNEPERLLPGGWGPPADFVTVAQMQSLVKNSASYIHTYGGGALATVGSAATTWMGQGLDFYCAHYNLGPNQPGGLTPPPSYASLGLDKPCVVEEFATADVSFGLTDTAQWSAEWWLNTIYEQGYAGAIGWAWHDSAGNWTSFQPVFTAWGAAHSAVVGP